MAAPNDNADDRRGMAHARGRGEGPVSGDDQPRSWHDYREPAAGTDRDAGLEQRGCCFGAWQDTGRHAALSFFRERDISLERGPVGGRRPYLFEGDIDYEAIAALRPDLILGIYSGIDDLAYKRLSSIAPTVAYRTAPWSADWKEQMDLTGQALGKTSEARAMIGKTATSLTAMGGSWPVLRGKTFTFGTYFAGGSGVVVYLPDDPRVAALLDLGLKVSPGVAALSADNPGQGSVTVGMEQVDRLDADILIMWYGEGARAAAEAQPLFMRLGAITRGSYVALEDPVSVWSTSALSVLSIPYGFPRFLPRLADAAERAGKER